MGPLYSDFYMQEDFMMMAKAKYGDSCYIHSA